MIWIGLYAATAIVVTTALFLLTEFLRAPGHAAPRHPGRYVVAAGLVWPVLLVAGAQYGLIAALGHGLSRTAAPTKDTAAPMQDVPARIAVQVG
jgi:hypothetical protein